MVDEENPIKASFNICKPFGDERETASWTLKIEPRSSLDLLDDLLDDGLVFTYHDDSGPNVGHIEVTDGKSDAIHRNDRGALSLLCISMNPMRSPPWMIDAQNLEEFLSGACDAINDFILPLLLFENFQIFWWRFPDGTIPLPSGGWHRLLQKERTKNSLPLTLPAKY